MDFLKNIFGSGNIPPAEVKECFVRHFPNARNVEWFKTDDGFEAVFFEGINEKIARISQGGKLLECRTNIFLQDIPEHIAMAASEKGEIMNCIAVVTADSLKYEMIIRNKNLTRFLLLLESSGNEIFMEKL